jgi:hypothetical protein
MIVKGDKIPASLSLLLTVTLLLRLMCVQSAKSCHLQISATIYSYSLCRAEFYFWRNSWRQQVPDLAIYLLNDLSYDKTSIINLIELGKIHLSVLDILS